MRQGSKRSGELLSDRSNFSWRPGPAKRPVREQQFFVTSQDCYAPHDEEDLAVHPKKLGELKGWVRRHMAIEKGPRFLLLTGPSGCGKATAVRVLCEELGIELLEFDGGQEVELSYSGDEIREKSLLTSFMQFLHNSQFSTICRMSLKHRLLLVGHLPNVFYRNPNLLHEKLSDMVNCPQSRCMIVFVMSNVDSCWELNPLRVFPANILDSLQIEHIKFKAISVGLLTKAVKRILDMARVSYNSEVIRRIILAADGDIRKAMNAINFSFGSRKGASYQFPSNHLDLFHFIGKVMYSKRAEIKNESWTKCEQKLVPKAREKFGRPFPPKDDIFELASSAYVSGSFLAGYVFEHEPNFAPSTSALRRVVSTLAECDAVFSNFEHGPMLDNYMMNTVISRTIFNNFRADNSKVSRKGLYQFEKPQFKSIEERNLENRLSVSQRFCLNRSADLNTLILPMLSQLRPTSSGKNYLELLKRICIRQQTDQALPLIQNLPPEYDISTTPTPPSSQLSPPISYHIDSAPSSCQTEMEEDGFNYDIEDD